MPNDKALQEAMAQVADHLHKHKPYLLEMDTEITKLTDGIVDFSVRVYHGIVTDIVIAQSRRITFIKKK